MSLGLREWIAGFFPEYTRKRPRVTCELCGKSIVRCHNGQLYKHKCITPEMPYDDSRAAVAYDTRMVIADYRAQKARD